MSDLPVPLEKIDRIEIVRGPASVLYGADAVGGVVNIITKNRPRWSLLSPVRAEAMDTGLSEQIIRAGLVIFITAFQRMKKDTAAIVSTATLTRLQQELNSAMIFPKIHR